MLGNSSESFLLPGWCEMRKERASMQGHGVVVQAAYCVTLFNDNRGSPQSGLGFKKSSPRYTRYAVEVDVFRA